MAIIFLSDNIKAFTPTISEWENYLKLFSFLNIISLTKPSLYIFNSLFYVTISYSPRENAKINKGHKPVPANAAIQTGSTTIVDIYTKYLNFRNQIYYGLLDVKFYYIGV